MIENIGEYIEYLIIELDILIKYSNKRRIKKLLIEYDILCNDDKIFPKLEKMNFMIVVYIFVNVKTMLKEVLKLPLKKWIKNIKLC